MIPLLCANIVTRYEVLRDHLMQGRWSHARNWRVVVQHGLLAWSQLPPSCPHPFTPPRPPERAGVLAALQAPVTHVLASMVLHVHPEVRDEN